MTNDETNEADELAAAEAWLDSLHPDDRALTVDDPADLRGIGAAALAIEDARAELAAAVAVARANGRSWGAIGMVLGISKQAARERFLSVPEQRDTPVSRPSSESVPDARSSSY
ncbi:MAG: sigma-70 family RNA polymerase sigma factor [Pseudonocardiales bacterium]|nr:sigma-70 family RNA polymerase sigma factor [Pseudonocardiales bacterium]